MERVDNLDDVDESEHTDLISWVALSVADILTVIAEEPEWAWYLST